MKAILRICLSMCYRRESRDGLTHRGVLLGSKGPLRHGDLTQSRTEEDHTPTVLRYTMRRAIAGLSIDVVTEVFKAGDEVPEDRGTANPGDVFHRNHLWQRLRDEPKHLVYQRPSGFLRRVDTSSIRRKRLTGSAASQNTDTSAGGPHRCEISSLDFADVLLMERRSDVGAERICAGWIDVDPSGDVDASLT
ncbi:hypothetical protein BKN51_28625 [Amycolatopsis sp. BJA-103]|nr:hypothetical protein BKN51_28625 [Amycolatopsis sp. BJA-103]